MTGYSTGDNNQLLEDGTYRYDYDAEGNRTAKYKDNDSSDDQSTGDTDITEYTWDHRNRLVKVTFRDSYGGAATKVVEYVYDHDDRWVAKLVNSDGDGGGQTLAVTDQYVYDGNQIIYLFDGDDQITNRHVWGPMVDQILADEQVHWDTSDYVTDDVLPPEHRPRPDRQLGQRRQPPNLRLLRPSHQRDQLQRRHPMPLHRPPLRPGHVPPVQHDTLVRPRDGTVDEPRLDWFPRR